MGGWGGWLSALWKTPISPEHMENEECLNGVLIKGKYHCRGGISDAISLLSSLPTQTGNSVDKAVPLFQPTYVSTEALGQAPACPGLLGPRERAGFGISPSGSWPPRQRTSRQGPGIEILKSRSHLRAGWLRAVLGGLVAGGGKRGVGSVDPGEVRKAGPKVRGEALRPGRCPKMAPPLVPQHLPREDASQAKLPWTPLPPHLSLLLSFS